MIVYDYKTNITTIVLYGSPGSQNIRKISRIFSWIISFKGILFLIRQIFFSDRKDPAVLRVLNRQNYVI